MYLSETPTHLSTNIMHIHMYTRIHTFVHAVWGQATIQVYYVPGWNPANIYIDLYIHLYIQVHTFVHAVWEQELTHDIRNSSVYTNAHRVHKSVHVYIHMNINDINIYRVSDWNPSDIGGYMCVRNGEWNPHFTGLLVHLFETLRGERVIWRISHMYLPISCLFTCISECTFVRAVWEQEPSTNESTTGWNAIWSW